MLPKKSIRNTAEIKYDYSDSYISSFKDKENARSSADVCRAFLWPVPIG